MSQVPVQPLHPYLVALQTATGAVAFLVTRHPATQIEHLGTQLELAHRLVVTTAHAERIANELRLELADRVSSAWGSHPYFLADWEEVLDLIGQFDHATGKRLTRAGVSVGDLVQVDLSTVDMPNQKCRGEVAGISAKRYLVRLHTPIGDFTGMWAPRSQIKPVVRVCALGGEAA